MRCGARPRSEAAGSWNAASAIDRVVLDADDRHRRRDRADRRGRHDIPARSAARDRAARRRRARARGRRDRARRRQARAAARDRGRQARTSSRASPGTSAIATPRCRWSATRLRIRRDHVLEDMLRGLGARLTLARGAVRSGAWRLWACTITTTMSTTTIASSTRRAVRAPRRAVRDGAIAALSSRRRRTSAATAPPQGRGRAASVWEISRAADERTRRGTATDAGTTAGNVNAAALYRLMAWLSPAYPVGAFSYSSGIEWAVEAGDITDAATLRRWLAVMIGDGGGFCDAVFFAHAHRAVAQRNDEALARGRRACRRLRAVRRSAIWKRRRRAAPSSRRRARPGRAPALDRLRRSGTAPSPSGRGRRRQRRARHRARARAARLSARADGQLDLGRRAAHPARPDRRPARARRARAGGRRRPRRARSQPPLDDVGGAAFRADLASMRHETQYTRLFRSHEA